MARNRIIKPEFWADAKVGRLSFGARLLYIAMWNFADDYGTISASPRRLLGDAFENDESVTLENVQDWLTEIETQGQIRKYTANEKDWYEIVHFKDHQRISHKSTRTNPQPPAHLSGDSPETLRQDTGSNGNDNGNDNGNGAQARIALTDPHKYAAETHLRTLCAKYDPSLTEELDRNPPPDYIQTLVNIAQFKVGRNMVNGVTAWEAAEKALEWMQRDKFWRKHASVLWLLDVKNGGQQALVKIKERSQEALQTDAAGERIMQEYQEHFAKMKGHGS